MEIEAERLAEHHLSAAARLYVDVFNAEPWNDAWTVDTAQKRLSDMLATPGAFGLVVRPHDPVAVLIGYSEQWYDGTHFYLKEMYVASRHQGTGIGTRLIRRLEHVLRQQGVDRVYLLTERSGPAADFYARLGFYRSEKMAMMAHRLH
jgi:GNAT superfamily N-acetyltransferase